MGNTRAGLSDDILEQLSATWPDLPWRQAVLRHGAFHVVAILADSFVLRVRTGNNRRSAIEAEVAAMRQFAELELTMTTPEVLTRAVHATGWSAFGCTYVPGSPFETSSWARDRTILLPALEELRSIDPRRHPGLPPARQWCGGSQFLPLLEEATKALSPPLRSAARGDARALLDAGTFGSLVVCHGDFGPHNVIDGPATGLIDPDNVCVGDESIDLAPLLGTYPEVELAKDFPRDLLERAALGKRVLPLQVAVAADMAGDAQLRDHALGNFATRNGLAVPSPPE